MTSFLWLILCQLKRRGYYVYNVRGRRTHESVLTPYIIEMGLLHTVFKQAAIWDLALVE